MVPLLVLLPLIESSTGLDTANGLDLLQAFGPTILTTLAWVGALILGGRTILRRVFEVCWRVGGYGLGLCGCHHGYYL